MLDFYFLPCDPEQAVTDQHMPVHCHFLSAVGELLV